MLKGLKKSKPEYQQEPEERNPKSKALKHDPEAIKAQVSESTDRVEKANQRLKQLNVHIMRQYLAAINQPELMANLECLKREQAQYLQLIRQQQQLPGKERMGAEDSKGSNNKGNRKFEYALNFEEEGRDRLSVKLRYKPSRRNDFCIFCPQNEQLVLLSAANFVYLALPKVKAFKDYHHYILAPTEHQQTRIGADSEVEEQLRNYQKCLIQMLQQLNVHAVFLEQFSQQNSHIYIECLGIPFKKAYDLPFYFKNALETVEGNWTSHKSIIEVRKEKGGLLKQIPKQIKYFYIDFGIGYGYAHAIENQREWDRKMVYEILATALNLETFIVKTTEEYNETQLRNKEEGFHKVWAQFDWTKLIDNQ